MIRNRIAPTVDAEPRLYFVVTVPFCSIRLPLGIFEHRIEADRFAAMKNSERRTFDCRVEEQWWQQITPAERGAS